MNNTFRNKLRNGALSAALTASIFGAGMWATPTPAYAIFCANCSTFYQQMFQYVEEVNTALSSAEQLSTQIQQYNNMVQQGTNLPSSMYSSITSDMQRVASIYNRSQALGRNISNLDSQFNTQYPDYQTYLKNFVQSSGRATDSMPDRYQKWSSTGMDNVKTSMEAANMNTSTFADENDQLSQMVARSQSAAGRQQSIQAGNEIAASNVQQLQKLRDLLATQTQMQGNYMAQQQERAGLDDAVRAQRRSGTLQNSATNKEY
ncbi:P-type conjugative transfer protein TrbJ [Pseudomonas sp.]|uniref:P-type conjugative transfer protein TrbJ n=1 Tax=Pseudomonas sp. TaxID=306 RepID=UPI003FD8FC22